MALLFALQGRKVTVELRNDVLVTGTLAEVDYYMNMYIDNAVWTPVWGPTQVWQALSTGVALLLCQRCSVSAMRYSGLQQLLHSFGLKLHFTLLCCKLVLLR